MAVCLEDKFGYVNGNQTAKDEILNFIINQNQLCISTNFIEMESSVFIHVLIFKVQELKINTQLFNLTVYFGFISNINWNFPG